MTDIEIDKALALAIGWKEDAVAFHDDMWTVVVHAEPNRSWPFGWRVFSHRDWTVIGPIAARYNAFPVLFDGDPKWYSNVWINSTKKLKEAWADTPQKAIALAVIGAKK